MMRRRRNRVWLDLSTFIQFLDARPASPPMAETDATPFHH